MSEHRYNFFVKFLYSYGNILISVLMLFNIAILIPQINTSKLFYFPTFVAFFVLFIVNRFYFLLYKTFPLTISSDNEKIVCTNFIFNKNRKEIIYYKDIQKISGGIFEGRLSGMMKITDKNNLSIAFTERISDSKKLIAKILQKVDKKLYYEVIESLNKLGKKLNKSTEKDNN